METSENTSSLVEKYRICVQKYIRLHEYATAQYWADKVVTQTNQPNDIYWLSQCMFLSKSYHRAVKLLQNQQLDRNQISCVVLAIKCYYEAGAFNEASQIINKYIYNEQLTNGLSLDEMAIQSFDADISKAQMASTFLILKGQVLSGLDNRLLATSCYVQALKYDCYCANAFDLLTKYQMLTANEERDLLDSIPFVEQIKSAEEAALVREMYEIKLKKYHEANVQAKLNLFNTTTNNTESTVDGEIEEFRHKLRTNNLDSQVSIAENLFYNCQYEMCLKITEEILKIDLYHEGCLPVHIACLIELKESTRLFSLAHSLVDVYPNLSITWYSVGCYYYVINNYDSARNFLTKSTQLDKLFGPAWLLIGHSFANQKEHDQAMAAYFKASQLMRGCHLPHLYIGVECARTNNIWLAQKFLDQAQNIAKEDPFTLQERGVVCFQKVDYKKAEEYFLAALNNLKAVIKKPLSKSWAPLLNNLGHCSRKLEKYPECLDYHLQAMQLDPCNPATASSIAFVFALMDRVDDAIEWFHKTLAWKRDDNFSQTMLNNLLERAADYGIPYNGCVEGVPNFETPNKIQETSNSLN